MKKIKKTYKNTAQITDLKLEKDEEEKVAEEGGSAGGSVGEETRPIRPIPRYLATPTPKHEPAPSLKQAEQ